MCLILTLCDRIVKYKEIANLSFTVHLSCEIYRFCKLGCGIRDQFGATTCSM